MSAYLTDPNKIGILALAIAAQTNQFGTAGKVAETLAKENLRSVGQRYRGNANEVAKDFMGISAAKYIHRCRQAVLNPANALELVDRDQLEDIADEYRYQSCECDDWPETTAAQALAHLEPVNA